MGWGKKIALLYISFVIFMSYLVYRSVTQKDIFLVSKDYYKDELAYENTIQGMRNVSALSQIIEIEQIAHSVQVSFPEECKGSTGNIRFFRPSDAGLDMSFPMKLDSENKQEIDTQELPKGLWIVKMDWQKANKNYYKEQKITL